MVCRNCKKEYSSEFHYCPYCAEPAKKENNITELKHLTREERVQRRYRNVTIVVSVLLFVFAFPICLALGWFFFPGTLENAAFHDKADTFAIIAWVSSVVVWIVLRFVCWQITKKSKMAKRVKRQIITDQFREDATSICPNCGSHNIKIYREGYNYTKGFWLRTVGVKGGGYVAGMNSNRARCRCMNCGDDWATNYDYRFIGK